MFLDNEFTKEYYQIIEEAQESNYQRDKYDFSFEEHHIIPRSLGGVNIKENRIILTREKHYICHSLLINMTVGDARFKMLHAWELMNSTRDIDGFILIGPDRYSEFKQERSRLMSEKYQREDNPNAKKVYQLDKQGNLIKIWPCVKDASDKYGGDISACARGQQNTSAGFIWIFEEDYTEEKVNEVSNPIDRRIGENSLVSRVIYGFNIKTKKIKSWFSLTKASEETGVNLGSISNCATGIKRTAGGYVWFFKEEYSDQKIKELLQIDFRRTGKNCHRSKVVYRLDTDNNILEIFDSATEAQEKYTGDIYACCRGRTKTAGKEYWCYEENYKGK